MKSIKYRTLQSATVTARNVILVCYITLAFCFMPCLVWAQAKAGGKNVSGSTIPSGQFVAVSSRHLCGPDARPIFSCVLNGNGKIMSLCTRGNFSRFYYVYGTPGSPDFIFPQKNKSTENPFMRTSLYYSGERDGYAYSFVEEDFRHIIYSISGSYGSKNSGLIVRRISGGRPMIQNMACLKSSTFEWNEQAVLDVTLKWPSDTDVAAFGLPGVR
jgi:hypothetical protein